MSFIVHGTPLGLRVHTALIFALAFTFGILIGVGLFH